MQLFDFQRLAKMSQEIFKKLKKVLDRRAAFSTFCDLSPLTARSRKAGKLFFINDLKADFGKNHFYFRKDLIVEMRAALSSALPPEAMGPTAERFFESKAALQKKTKEF
ncbi:MAG: hypothetical protein ACOC4K_04550 [Verrucomicrobiota bacterium]